MKKKVLFVTYGGGHAAMIVPVIRSLEKYTDIEIESLALTTGGAYFKRHGLPYKGYKDLITPEDTQALEYGEKLSAIHHNPESGIDEVYELEDTGPKSSKNTLITKFFQSLKQPKFFQSRRSPNKR